MDPQQRSAYNSDLDRALADEDDGYTGEPLSKWMANTRMGKNTDANESRAVFVVSFAVCDSGVGLEAAGLGLR